MTQTALESSALRRSTKLSATEKRTLAVIGERLTIGDMSKNKFRQCADELARYDSDLVVLTEDWSGYELTPLGELHMARATAKNNNFSRWAEAKKLGAGQRMADYLNADGVDRGLKFLKELGIE